MDSTRTAPGRHGGRSCLNDDEVTQHTDPYVLQLLLYVAGGGKVSAPDMHTSLCRHDEQSRSMRCSDSMVYPPPAMGVYSYGSYLRVEYRLLLKLYATSRCSLRVRGDISHKK